VEADGLLYLEGRAIGVETSHRRAEDLVKLGGVGDPFAGDVGVADEIAEGFYALPEHAVEIIGYELSAFQPALRGGAVEHLDELERIAFDLAMGGFVVVMAHTRMGEDGVGVVVEAGDEEGEMIGEVEIVGGQIGDIATRGMIETVVERRTQTLVAVESVVVNTGVLKKRFDQATCIIR